MVYLHCGWPKTGTTSLQAALVAGQEQLAAAGLLYPERWRRDSDGSHNDLPNLLQAHLDRGCGFDELCDLLSSQDGNVLFSSESLTLWVLLGEHRYRCMLEFLAAMQEVMPVRCIWTLRRFDEVLHSIFRQMSMRKGLGEPKMASLLDHFRIEDACDRMRGLESLAVDGAVYVRYEPTGGHNAALLRSFDVPEEVVASVCSEIDAAPRLNPTPSWKQIVAAENIGAIAARSGVELDRDAVCHAFEHDGFRFQHDGPCVLFGPELRRGLHERMLASARDCGVVPYDQFFGDENLAECPPATRLEADVLTDEDVRQLVTHLQHAPGAV